jgi:hypothetical protein
MDIKKQKLDLIKAISRCEDAELLATLAEILHLDTPIHPPIHEPLASDNPPWDIPNTKEADDLQQSIDEIFNP